MLCARTHASMYRCEDNIALNFHHPSLFVRLSRTHRCLRLGEFEGALHSRCKGCRGSIRPVVACAGWFGAVVYGEPVCPRVFAFVAFMSHRKPVTVTEISKFDCIIDARTPAEFALDHLPGAINCPVLSDEERVTIGTIYKQVSPFEAKRLGAALVAANLARHLQTVLADKPADWKPLVYCWRGGLRSGSMVTWLRMVGWDAQQLAGGYKAFRHHVVDQLEALLPLLQLRVLCGATGSAKTRVLHALQAQGAQVLDLEGLACHKGSLLGALPGIAQPSQKHFESLLLQKLQSFDLCKPVFVEGESPKIGRVALPLTLVQHMRQAPVLEIAATADARLAFLLRDYAYLGDEVEHLCTRLGYLKEIQGNEAIARWQDWARSGNLPALFDELMRLHYDPQYERSQSKHFVQWPQRVALPASDLSPEAVQRLADQCLGQAAVDSGHSIS